MRYSVIIPVYNVQDKLSRCIDSLICQSFHDYEIILVNDGSADHSGEICQKYAKQFEFIKYIEKENGGASSARNTGLDNAVGDYVLFIDSDDYAEENYFEMISQYSVQNGLCVFTYTWKRQNGFQKRNIDLSMTQKSISHFEITKQLILSRTINSPCAKVFDRNLIEKYNLRFDEKMPVAEDFNFCLAYLMRCDNVCVVN